MTSREKASELIVNYQLQCKSLDYQQAKQCALIAVDEIIEVARDAYDEEVVAAVIIYWNKVKQEIEKL